MSDNLQHATDLLISLIESGDLCSALILLLILFLIGARVVAHAPNLARWGKFAAFATFLGYVGLRCATDSPTNAEELTVYCLRGLLAAGFACAVCWILLPVAALLWSMTCGRTMRTVRHGYDCAKRAVATQRTARKRDRDHRAAQRAWGESGPQREQERAEAATRAAAAAETAAAAQQRREEARMRVELLYERHAKQLAMSFPRDRFEQFLERYMNDQRRPEEVEQREELLKETLADSLGSAPRLPRFTSFSDLAAYFDARRQEIDALSCDKRTRDRYVVELNEQEDMALRRFLTS